VIVAILKSDGDGRLVEDEDEYEEASTSNKQNKVVLQSKPYQNYFFNLFWRDPK